MSSHNPEPFNVNRRVKYSKAKHNSQNTPDEALANLANIGKTTERIADRMSLNALQQHATNTFYRIHNHYAW